MAQQPPPGGQPPQPYGPPPGGGQPPPQGYPPQGYPPPQQPGYGQPPPQGYPPQQPGYGQPPPQGYPPQQPGYGQPGPYGQGGPPSPYGPPPGAPYGGPGYGPAGPSGGYASWGKRLIAIIIDSILVGIPASIVMSMLGAGYMATVEIDPTTFQPTGGGGFFGRVIVGQLIYALFAIPYAAYFHATKGQTVGKMAMKIKVISETSGGLLDMSTAAIRAAAQSGMGVIPFLGLIDGLFPLWDPKKQSLHDKAAKSIVVDAP